MTSGLTRYAAQASILNQLTSPSCCRFCKILTMFDDTMIYLALIGANNDV